MSELASSPVDPAPRGHPARPGSASTHDRWRNSNPYSRRRHTVDPISDAVDVEDEDDASRGAHGDLIAGGSRKNQNWLALKGGRFIIGTYAGTTAGGNFNKADDDPTFNDRIRFGNDGVTAANLGTHIPFEFEIEIEDASQNAFSDLALPLTLPDLALFTERSWRCFSRRLP